MQITLIKCESRVWVIQIQNLFDHFLSFLMDSGEYVCIYDLSRYNFEKSIYQICKS